MISGIVRRVDMVPLLLLRILKNLFLAIRYEYAEPLDTVEYVTKTYFTVCPKELCQVLYVNFVLRAPLVNC